MKSMVFITISISLFIAGLSFAESTALPRFEDYPVNNVYQGKPKPVNLRSHPEARTWRTMLRRGAKEGPNFSGHYTIVKWGCGTSCDGFAIVDAATGTVYFPKILYLCCFGLCTSGT